MAEFPEVYEEQAKIFKALGHPARLMMVEAMLEILKQLLSSQTWFSWKCLLFPDI